jgi:NACHT domain
LRGAIPRSLTATGCRPILRVLDALNRSLVLPNSAFVHDMKPNTRFFLYSVVLVLALATLSNLITEIVRAEGGIGVAITMTVLISTVLFIVFLNSEPSKTLRQIEIVLMKKLRTSWIQSLIEVKRIENVKEGELSWISRATGNVAQHDVSLKVSKIAKAFKQADRSLLIIGEQGAGKTLVLLQLASSLVEVAERDQKHDIPVVLNLSSFGGESLEEWFVSELKRRYDVAEEIGRGWLLRHRLILLLDGLDEARDSEHCAEAIGEFLKQSPRTGIAVAAAPGKVELTGIKSAVKVLNDGKSESELRELVAHRFKGASRLDPPFALPSVLAWLHWLANGSINSGQSQFTVAQIQPNWLQSKSTERVYLAISRVAGAALVMAVGAGLLFLSRAVVRIVMADPKANVPGLFEIENHLKWWLLVTVVVGGLTIAFVDSFHASYFLRHSSDTRRQRWRQSLLSLTAYTVPCLAVFFAAARLRIDFMNAMRGAVIFAVAYGVVFWFRRREQGLETDTHTADQLVWSPAGILRGVLLGVVGGIICGGLFAFALKSEVQPDIKLHLLLLLVLLGALVGLIAGGLRRISIVENTSPRQGMQLSIRSTILIWLLVGPTSTIVIWGYVHLIMHRPDAALGGGLFYGMVLGLLCGFAYSGFGIVYRFVFRCVLWQRRHAPLIDLVQFLDYVSDLGLLHKVGGGYVFAQTALRELLARAETPNDVLHELRAKEPSPQPAVVTAIANPKTSS